MTEIAATEMPGVAMSQLALPRAAVRVLAACAESARLCPELELGDDQAQGFFTELGGCRESFGSGELRCAAFRTSVVDQLALSFFERNPTALGVSLWPMLGTRAHRLHVQRWLELDAPPLAALRDRYLPARSGLLQRASCLCNVGAVATNEGGPGPRLFVMDESVLPLCAEAMQRVLDSIATHASPGSELIVAFDDRAPFRRSHTGGVLEIKIGSTEHELARYPRLSFVDDASYSDDLRSALAGVNTVARLQGHDAPSLAHLLVR